MAEPFLGEIRIFAGNYAPQNWAFCDGSALSITQYEALYSLIGTTYGGDGVQTFNLPDLRGRVPVNQGQAPSLSRYVLGEAVGVEHVALTLTQYPSHSHAAIVSSAAGTQPGPGGNMLAASQANKLYVTNKPSTEALNSGAVPPVGGGQAHGNLQPLLVVSYIIALQGTFPASS